MVHFEVPKEYSFVIGAGLFSSVVLTYLSNRVNNARKTYSVALPALYADQAVASKDENARKFNCVQRGHQNALESHPTVLMMCFVGGLRHPIFTSFTTIIWSFGRIAYANGYATGDPSNRLNVGYAAAGISMLALFGASVSTALSIVGRNPLDKK